MDNMNVLQIDERNVELRLYGEIVDSVPTDWWGDPIEGDFIVRKDVAEALDNAAAGGAEQVTLRVDSVGGDAGVSIFLHNKLREMSRNGIRTRCIVDGVAMSGGSLIMCGCDEVTVNPASIIMIHKCWSFLFGGYNSDDLSRLAKSTDAWDDAQANIYNRKTGMSKTQIKRLMRDTTYMTGTEAVELRFADSLTEDEPAVVSIDEEHGTVEVNGRQMKARFAASAAKKHTVSTDAKAFEDKYKSGSDTDKDIREEIMAKNFEELKAENAELAEIVKGEILSSAKTEEADRIKTAIESERARIAAIDEIAPLYDEETVRSAKYGEHPMTAQELAFKAAQDAAKAGAQTAANVLENIKKDTADSGVQNVPEANGEETPQMSDEEAARVRAEKLIKQIFSAKEEK